MRVLHLDLETYSSSPLPKCGVYRYCDSSDFEILLLSYAFDDGPVITIDLACGETLPDEFLKALEDPTILKIAHNAVFERVCFSKYLGHWLDPAQWRCTMVMAWYSTLPGRLADVAVALNVTEKKMGEGKDLIRYFSVPCKPTKTNGGRTRNLPQHAPEKWAMYKKYNAQDVEAERAVYKALLAHPLPEHEWVLYALDQRINDRGVRVDRLLVKQAMAVDLAFSRQAFKRAQELTGLENPGSVSQLKAWLADMDMPMESLSKRIVQEKAAEADGIVKELLELRLELSKTSIKKYEAMARTVCRDGRVHGMLQFGGASRTFRWAGRLVQLQNVPQNHLPDLRLARDIVKRSDEEQLEMLFGSVPNTLSELIRTAFIPRDGCRFIAADFSAIEARVIAWLAGEEWRMKAFANGEDIYCASASKMFGVPVVKHGENGHLRQKGKISELACGFGGSVGAMKAMGADSLGLSDTELKQIVTDWREASPHITELWWAVDRAVKKAVKEKTATKTHGLLFSYEAGFLFIRLPSGRRLAYAKPYIGKNKFGGESVTYMGINAQKKWDRLESYGPKFVENCVQGIARDLLMYSMQALSQYFIVGHIHDEMIIECPKDTKLDEICQQMARTPDWAKGLLLRADGYECSFYKKD